ncbi:MAG: hypothetical protein LBV12_09730 [Puniceicoccales bacterium]|jgi:peptidyl-prolyl cis-trans isomerase D|nr:hypothetical protein [Puniceicoccales bacterium]
MITWLQTSFGRHHKLLLGLLLGITIISFVFFGAWSGAQGGRGQTYLGVKMDSPRALERYMDALRLSGRGNNISYDDLKFQIFRTHLADVAQIPDPTAEQLKKFLPGALNTTESEVGKRVSDIISVAMTTLGTSKSNAEVRVERFLADLWRMQKAMEILAGPGYAQPFEAAMEWSLENTQWTVEAATLAGEKFSPTITPDEEKVQAYFESHKEQYKLPPRVTLAYAVFPPEKVEIDPATEKDLRKYAMEHTADFPDLDVGKLDEYLQTHRAEIEKRWKDEQIGIQTASRISTLIADEMPIGGTAPGAEKIDQILAANKITTTAIPSFDENSVPNGLQVPANILRQGLELSENVWRSDAYTLGTSAVVLFHKKTDPARDPELAEVREKVTADYIQQEKSRLFAERVTEVGKKLREEVAAGKKFEDVAKELTLQVKSYPAFKFMTMPPDFFGIYQTLIPSLNETPVGSVTPVLRSGPDAIYVLLVKKELPQIDMTAPEIQTKQEQMAAQATMTTLQGSRQSGMPGMLAELYGKSNPQPTQGN